jgi:hypothetical protein
LEKVGVIITLFLIEKQTFVSFVKVIFGLSVSDVLIGYGKLFHDPIFKINLVIFHASLFILELKTLHRLY